MRNVIFLAALILAACQPPEEPPSIIPFPNGPIVDLTYPFNSNTVYWPTAAGFELTTDFEGQTDGGYYYSAYTFSTAEHGGTHLDAPVHFSEGKHATDEIELERLMGPAALIDVSGRALEDRDYQISIDDVREWESENGELLEGVILLFKTGYGQYWPDREAYMGTDERGEEAVANLHFPGIDPSLAEWLVEKRDIGAVGIDTPSIDYGQSETFLTHQRLLGADIPAFENVANLDKIPSTNFDIIALPMKIDGGSGGPLRIVAIL